MLWYVLNLAGSGQGQVADTCECGDEPSGSMKCGEFLDYMRTCQLLKKDSAAWSNICLAGGGVDWIDLAQGRDKWWHVAKAVLNIRIPKMRGVC